LSFLAKNQQLSIVMLMGKQQTPPLWKWTKQEQVWHQVKNATVGLQLMTRQEAEETGTSVTPSKSPCSGVRVDGANVLTNSQKTSIGIFI